MDDSANAAGVDHCFKQQGAILIRILRAEILFIVDVVEESCKHDLFLDLFVELLLLECFVEVCHNLQSVLHIVCTIDVILLKYLRH